MAAPPRKEALKTYTHLFQADPHQAIRSVNASSMHLPRMSNPNLWLLRRKEAFEGLYLLIYRARRTFHTTRLSRLLSLGLGRLCTMEHGHHKQML